MAGPDESEREKKEREDLETTLTGTNASPSEKAPVETDEGMPAETNVDDADVVEKDDANIVDKETTVETGGGASPDWLTNYKPPGGGEYYIPSGILDPVEKGGGPSSDSLANNLPPFYSLRTSSSSSSSEELASSSGELPSSPKDPLKLSPDKFAQYLRKGVFDRLQEVQGDVLDMFIYAIQRDDSDNLYLLCRDYFYCDNTLKRVKMKIDDPVTEDGGTLLHLACEYGSWDCAKFLLENDADLQAKKFDLSTTPFHLACSTGRTDIIKLLFARRPDLKPLLLTSTCNQNSGLHLAATGNHVDTINLLIGHGAPIVYCPPNSKTPSEVADEGSEAWSILSSYEDDIRAIFSGEEGKELERLPQERWPEDNEERNQFEWEGGKYRLDKISLINTLKGDDADSLSREINSLGPLGVDAAMNRGSSSLLHLSCLHGKFACTELLLARGASISKRNCIGRTPLHEACLIGHEKIVQLLLSRADFGILELSDVEGDTTPLDCACALETKTMEMLEKEVHRLLEPNRLVVQEESFYLVP